MTALLARLAGIALAVLVGFALPVGGLRVVRVDVKCCCPSPERCKCKSHEPLPDEPPAMQACHKTLETFSTPPIQAYVSPVLAVVDVAIVVATVGHRPLAAPHEPPLPRRPDAPS